MEKKLRLKKTFPVNLCTFPIFHLPGTWPTTTAFASCSELVNYKTPGFNQITWLATRERLPDQTLTIIAITV